MISLSKISTSSLLITLAFSAPTPTAPIEAAKALEKRFTTSCTADSRSQIYTSLTVDIANDNRYDSGGCGRGFLDNFRSACGVITDWGCNNVAGTDNVIMTFKTPMTCSGESISSAIFAASNGEMVNIHCF